MKHVNFIVAIVLGALAAFYFMCLIFVLTSRFYYLLYNPQYRMYFSILPALARSQIRLIDVPLAKIWQRFLCIFGIGPFSYEKLDPEKNEIRLLKLLPGPRREKIKCVIFRASLDDKDLRYETLSYTWRSPLPVRTILLNSKKFFVTPNLHAALQRLRRIDEPRILWIDAACINQLDFAERSQQVGLMRRVYSQASTVCVWLGAQKCHNEVQRLFTEAKASKDYSAWVQSTIGDKAYTEAWREVRRLLSREYWYRMWVIQEVALASSITVMCGDTVLRWDILLTCDTIWKHSFRRRNIEHYDWICQVERVPGWRLLRIVYAWPDMKFFMLSESQTMIGPESLHETHLDVGLSASRHISFPELVFRHSRSRATDRKDKIYALLGLTADPLMSDFVANYTIRSLAAYKALVQHYIAKSGKLDIITYGTTDGNRIVKRISTWIPDWCPDENFAEARQQLSKLTAIIPYDAARGTIADVRYMEGTKDNDFNPRLQLKGCIIDRVQYDWKMPDSMVGANASAPHMEATQQLVSDWYTEISNHYDNKILFREIFWRALVGNRNLDGNTAPEEWAVAFEVVILGESSLPAEYMAESTISTTERARLFTAPYLSAVSQHMTNRYIFTTTLGYIGVAPLRGENVFWESKVIRYLKPERYLCIFPGCSFPMVLQMHLVRRLPNIEKLLTAHLCINWIWTWRYTDDYDLVGAAYLHGFMEGQAISDVENGLRTFEDIILA